MRGDRITHGRHCTCSACAREDWTNPDLAPCGMHGTDCPALYQPLGPAGTLDKVCCADGCALKAVVWLSVSRDTGWAFCGEHADEIKEHIAEKVRSVA